MPLLVADSMFFPYITGKNFAFRILVEIGLLSWLLLALYDKTYRPRFSWIVITATGLLVVMFFANFFGEYAPKSIWSNFERMDGYITLLHFVGYFLLVAHALRTRLLWQYFLHTSLAVAAFVALRGLGQALGFIEGQSRVDSTLGNAAYMAVYMLFHIFILLFVSLNSRTWWLRILYALLGLLFVYVLLETGTRGTFIGLVVGLGVSVSYLSLFGRSYPEIRKVAIGGLLALVTLSALFFVFRDHALIQQNNSLSRIANISLTEDLSVRTTIWGMAWSGFKERPLLGWGQGGFNYVFNQEYEPSLYRQEPWFDRVHNIFFDWLIAGGILGFLAYFGILISTLYYLFWRPHFTKQGDESFTVLERAVLLGLLAGYFTHNLVVFDNIVSYLYYAVLLALIHYRVATPWSFFENFKVKTDTITTMVTPAALVTTVLTVYLVNVPGILAAGDIIDALRTRNVSERMTEFQSAINRNSFANQEIVEQMAAQGLGISLVEGLPANEKSDYLLQIEEEFQKFIKQKPNDARLHVVLAGFYRSTGAPLAALRELEVAAKLSPKKPQIKIDQGLAAIQSGDFTAALLYLRQAYELAPDFTEPTVFYAAGAAYAGDYELYESLVGQTALSERPELERALVENSLVIQALLANQQWPLLVDLAKRRINLNPVDPEARINLALIHAEMGNHSLAISTIEEAIVDIPELESQGKALIENLKSGGVDI